ncbi:response regulator [Vibrio sp. SCSIO 43140]|uniref:hybrid sensor histidine kinase/response regulator n=1 Tax=Vibrio sp. SCSIO 43140 TaxID=2819100 RepID=UPI00207543EA|nr:ATP-binding protein [Vibrio sp. SCSIO 43140]USD62063.1 response regulator [Vibrio sp. SCSIO 43140]
MPPTQSNPSRTIRKILLIGACTILGLLAVFFYTERTVDNTKEQLIGLQKDILASANTMLMMRRHEKDFIARVDTKYLERMEDEYLTILSQIGQINIGVATSGIEIDYDGQTALSRVDDYTQRFFKLSELVLLIHGDNQQEGLIEHFKNKALAFERALIDADSRSMDFVALSTKDLMYQFFSTFDPEILPRIERNLSQLEKEITDQQLSFEMFSRFQEFRLAFYGLQGAYEEFGYSHYQGELGELRATIHQLEGALNTLFNELPPLITQKLRDVESNRVLATIAFVATVLLVLLYIIRQISALEKQLIYAREHEIQANRAKSAFLANMSHEIRTPLNGILGMTEILGDTRLTASQKDHLATINASSQTLLMLINDILDLSKIESGHLEICPHTTAIKETIYDTAALIAPKAQQKSLDILIEIDPDVPDYVQADEQKVRQTLMNLASNAIKFTEAGHIAFKLKGCDTNQDTVTLGFVVADTGIGIDQEKQKRVFEEFKQENSDTSKDYGGTGLGLAICSKMVEMMGGKITLTSAKGKGSTFSFELTFERDSHSVKNEINKSICYVTHSPNLLLMDEFKRYKLEVFTRNDVDESFNEFNENTIVVFDDASILPSLKRCANHLPHVLLRDNKAALDCSNIDVSAFITSPLFGNRLINTLKQSNVEQSEETADIKVEDNADRKHFKILVVEDNKVNQQIVSLNLKKLSIDFVIANNGQEAVDIYQQQHSSIGLVLMDCMMPVLDGFEATKAIREFEKSQEIKQTHIIALTASVLDDDIKKCYDSGMDDYLPKPFKRDILMEKLDARFQNA